MSSAERFVTNYSVDDYRHWEGEWQLIQGAAVSMSPSPAGPHELAVARLLRLLGNQLEAQGSNCETYAGLDWIVDDHNVFRPDLMVVCGEQPEVHLEKPPILVAEVLSPATWKIDTGIKRDTYQRQGVRIYLIVDPDLKSIEVIDFRDNSTTTLKGSRALEFSLDDMTAIEISTTKIFR